ncbi:MAG: GNAT family N-acetyltransferase, partial [Firmicutes bacterium]|nr:GNAT family N-acetyltransferase [Bacillota bacterium]
QAKAYPDRLRIYIIENEECEIIGYAIIQLIWSNEWGGLTANIDEMYIVESARGQGVGSGFIKAVSKLIPDVNRVTLEVTPSNRKALELYEKLGFRLAENKCMEKTLL